MDYYQRRRATPSDIQQFMDDFSDPFLLWKDEDHGFGMAVGARITPNVYMPTPLILKRSDHSATEGMAPIKSQAYIPLLEEWLGSFVYEVIDDPFGQMNGYQGDLVCSQCHGRRHKAGPHPSCHCLSNALCSE